MTEREALAALLRERSVSFGDFLLSSGQRSHYYIDARRTTMSAEGQVLIGRVGLDAIRQAGWSPRSVGGLTMGADPIAYSIARASVDAPPLIHAFSVRKAAKDHGTGRRIEGHFEPGTEVVVIEDTVTSGGSAIQAVEAVREAGGVVLGVLALVDRESGGKTRLEASGLRVVVITTTTELLGKP
ncbi:MAG: orotate phosphoribosyltransferase [Gemmatimonadales bacterium]|nr:orotate phosphoribosyltransferase [Gemmatimonadales bacterium]